MLAPAAAQQVHISHCQQQCPETGVPNQQIIVRHLYVAAVAPDQDLAQWVAYRVLRDSVGVASLLPRYWQQEELLPGAGSVETGGDGPGFFQPDLSDRQDRSYRINEIVFQTEDRGRLAPMTSFADTPYWEELNRLSNMAPLPTDLRIGAWARLEQAINRLADRAGEVFVVAGPIYRFAGAAAREPDAGQQPSAFFKVVAVDGELAAFVFPAGLAIHAAHCGQRSSLEEIEAATALRLFPAQQSFSENLFQALGCRQ